MKLLTIIVNYKTAEMTIRAIRSLMTELAGIPGARAVVVDNDSQDGSHDRIAQAITEEGWSDRVTLLASGHNGGFGYGNNVGIRHGLESSDPPEYLYLLNSDAFPDPGSIRALVGFLDAHPEAGIAGSYIHGPDGDPHQTSFRFPTAVSEFEAGLRLGVVSKLLRSWIVPLPIPTSAQQVDWLAGASMMIRRDVLRTVGLFDETFFLYFEETDLCRRAQGEGWATYFVPESSVAHIGSVSTGMKDTKRRTPSYWFASRRHYFLKNHGRRYLWAANAAFVVGFSLWRVRRRVQGKPDPDRPSFLSDFIRYNLLHP